MKWIKVLTLIDGDEDVRALARELNIDIVQAVGHCVLVFCNLAKHQKDGNVGTDERDDRVEFWAAWQGRRRRFARAFRKCLCSEDGTVYGWDGLNGALIREEARTRIRAMNPVIRRKAIERDGARCIWCGDNEAKLEVDHIVTWADGGTHDLDNLRTLCQPCHRLRHKNDKRRPRTKKAA